MSAGSRKRAQGECVWAEIFSSVTESEFPDFQIVATLGIVETNSVGLLHPSPLCQRQESLGSRDSSV